MEMFGSRLRRIREERHLTQTDLAHRMRDRGFGTTQTTVSRWESGQIPQGFVWRALAAELGTTVDELFGSDEDEEAAPADEMREAFDMFVALMDRINHRKEVAA